MLDACRPSIVTVTGRISEHSRKDEHKHPPAPVIQAPARHLVLTNLPALVCHVACAFRAMALNRLYRSELTVNKSRIQQAFVATGAGLTMNDWNDALRYGFTDSILPYHPKEPLRMHSVNDTLAKVLPSLQFVSTTNLSNVSARVKTRMSSISSPGTL